MDEEKNEEIKEETSEENSEEETSEEVTEESVDEAEENFEEEKDADYARDDIIKMLKSQRDAITEIKGAIEGIKDIVAIFVENGGTVREDVVEDENEVVEEDFGLDNVGIDELDLSL